MSDSLQTHLSGANPQTLADALRALGLGDMVRKSMCVALRDKSPAMDAAQDSSLKSFGLDKEAPAVTILAAYARCATNGGSLAVIASGTTPATGQIAIAPNGDIVCLGADAITHVDIDYIPLKGDVVTLLGVPLASNAFAIPSQYKCLALLKATANTGTSTGQKQILVPSGSAAANGQSRLDVVKGNVKFASGDAVLTADLVLLVASAIDVDALLQATSGTV